MIASTSTSAVQSYFEGIGFERFHRLHCNQHRGRLQSALREGHDQTLRTVLEWLGEEPGLHGVSICDAGCGAGALSIALAQTGARVHAVDFSHRMVAEAQRRADELRLRANHIKFDVADFTELRGEYDAVVCIDVFARYPLQQVLELLARLSRLARSRLILSFTPKTRLDGPLLKLGNLYARRHSLPALYTYRAEVIIKAIEALGWNIKRQAAVSSRFNLYYCQVLDLVRMVDQADLPMQRSQPRYAAQRLQDSAFAASLARCPYAAQVIGPSPVARERDAESCVTPGGDQNYAAQLRGDAPRTGDDLGAVLSLSTRRHPC